MNIPNTLHAPDMPLHTHWTSHDLAAAVPLRLSQLLDFDAASQIGTPRSSANTTPPRHAPPARSFLQNPMLPFFRIR